MASRVSQESVEVVYAGSPASRASQLVVEVVYVDSGAAPGGGTSRSFVVMVG